jgi:hypothetical protein
MINDFFPQKPDLNPVIYAYEDTSIQYKGLLKGGSLMPKPISKPMSNPNA